MVQGQQCGDALLKSGWSRVKECCRVQTLNVGSSPCAACMTQQTCWSTAVTCRPALYLLNFCSIQQVYPSRSIQQACLLHTPAQNAGYHLTYAPTPAACTAVLRAASCLSGRLPGFHAPFMLPGQALPALQMLLWQCRQPQGIQGPRVDSMFTPMHSPCSRSKCHSADTRA